jgi:hypothetical protein
VATSFDYRSNVRTVASESGVSTIPARRTVGERLKRSRAAHGTQIKPGAGIPGTIAPHDSAMTWFEMAELAHEGFDVYRKAATAAGHLEQGYQRAASLPPCSMSRATSCLPTCDDRSKAASHRTSRAAAAFLSLATF